MLSARDRAAVLLAAAAFLHGGVALAKVPCETEGLTCEVEGVAGVCTVDLQGELSCLADYDRACASSTPGGDCVVFDVEEGTCTALGERGAVCVPLATNVRCNEAALGASCALEDRSPGTCFPDGGELGCVPDPGGCLVAELDASCVTAEGLDGWCRDLSQDSAGVVCTTACDDAGNGNFCRSNVGEIGECRSEGEAGLISCVLDPSTCPAEGDTCTNADGDPDRCILDPAGQLVCGDLGPCGRTCPDGPDGEPGRCHIGGAGSGSCTYGDEDDGSGCCGSPEPEAALQRERRGPSMAGIGLLGLALVSRRRWSAKRQR